MTTISIIIPAYNDILGVLTALNNLKASAANPDDIEFRVQDDCSPDVFFPALIPNCAALVIRNEHNMGFGKNCNLAAIWAEGDILFFVNQDVSAIPPLSNNWTVPLLAAFDDPEVGIVGPKLLFPNGAIQSAGGLIDATRTPFHRCLGYSNHLHADVNTPREVSWVTGAALAIRADLFRELGGFDSIYAPAYFEDVDLCLRAREAGYKVWYEPRCCLQHTVASTGGSPSFSRSAQAFKQRWVDTKRVEPDTTAVSQERYW